MVLMITVIAIVVAFSLYDYFQSRSWQSVTSTLRNDEVFENRNKAYGAYQIRKDYNKRVVLIMLSMFGGLGALWGANVLFNHKIEQKKESRIVVENIAELFKKDEAKPEVEQKKDVEQAAPDQQFDQIKFPVPQVVDSIIKTPDIKIPDGETQVGKENKEGDGKNPFDIPPPDGPGGDGNGKKIEIITTDGIQPIVDEEAIFPGGLSAMRKFIADNIDLNNVDGGSKMYMKFVVDEKGEISRVSVTKATKECPSCEKAAIKVIKEMPKWTPGKINGEPVKSYYRIPITILE